MESGVLRLRGSNWIADFAVEGEKRRDERKEMVYEEGVTHAVKAITRH